MSDDSPANASHVVMERGFTLGFVGMNGEVRLLQFRLGKKGFSADRAADDGQFATLLDAFTASVQGLLEARWGGPLAMRAAFDGEGELIERLYEVGMLSRCDAVDPVSPAGKLVKDGEVVDARELLVRASARLVENWGVFDHDDDADARLQRLRDRVAGPA